MRRESRGRGPLADCEEVVPFVVVAAGGAGVCCVLGCDVVAVVWVFGTV